MDSSNHDHEWKNKLPKGFHFVPTDEELIMYLRLKSSTSNITRGIFNDLDVYQYEPHKLYGFTKKHWNERMYFFTPLMKKYIKGNKIQRVIHSGRGWWKASQARKKIFKNNNQIGTKTSLVYYEHGRKTSWLMLEYRFPDKIDSLQQSDGSDYELTLCVIYYFNNKKNADDQVVVPVESNNHIPLQYFSLQQHQPFINWTDVASRSTMQPSFSIQQLQPPINWADVASNSTMQPSFSIQQYQPAINCAVVASSSTMQPSFSIQQHQPPINWADVASTSTMQPSFSIQQHQPPMNWADVASSSTMQSSFSIQQHQPLMNRADVASTSTMQSSFSIQQHQQLMNWTDVASTSTMQPSFSIQQHQPLINWADIASSSTMQPSFSIQHQPLINWPDVASSSTMQPSFSELPYSFMNNFEFFPSDIPQNNYDFHGFDPSISPYHNLDNSHYIWDDKIGHIPNSSVDFVDQNTLEICVSPIIAQDDQRPSMDSQDHDHQEDNKQLKMKKIKM